ncbi:MAG: type II toxin-antitoxin system RelE/ParE family toxin [Candidatus Hodarchaeota archaeon]
MYEVLFTETAKKQLKSLPRNIRKRIIQKIEEIARDITHVEFKKLTGTTYYRLRIGDYRVIFDIKTKELIILIIKVGHRKKIYKKP